MSREIEERVVEMRFNNSQFESETKKTLSTLERLKMALNFTNSGKEIDKMGKSFQDIRLDGIAAGVESLTKRFSTFGIIGMQVIQNLTNAMTSKLVGALHYVEDAIKTGGIRRAMNIENAHFQLQALLKDEEKVQAVMANAMEAVDGTAYAYDEAAKAASMFAASGLQAGDDMLNALKGITGVAAMTNSEFEAISMIFTTVAGNGRLMGDQLIQLSSRGLNAASTIADYMREVQHQSKITEKEVRDMVSKGGISFKTFADAMNWAFGESAKRANETFTGAMSNMKSALARIGAGFVSPLVEQNGVMVDMFNSLRVKINDVKKELVFDKESSAIGGLTKTLGMSAKAAEKFYTKVEKNGKATIKSMDTIKKHGQDGYAALRDYFNGINDGSIRASYSITSTVEKLTDGNKVTRKDIKKWVKAGKVDFDTWSSAIEEAFGSEHQKLSKQFTDTVIKSVDAIRTELDNFDVTKITKLFYKGFNSTKNVLYGLWTVVKPLGRAFSDIFLGFNYKDVSNFATSIEKLTKKFRLSDESAEKLERTFHGVFDITKLLGEVIGRLIHALFPFAPTVKEGSGALLDMSANLGDNLSKFAEWVRTSPKVEKGFALISKGSEVIAKGLSVSGHKVSEFIDTVMHMEQTQKVLKNVQEWFGNTNDKIQDISEELLSAILGFLEDIDKIDLTSPKEALKGLEKAFDSLGNTLIKNERVNTFIDNFKTFLKDLSNAFSKDSIEAKLNGVEKAFDRFMTTMGKFGEFLKTKILPLFQDITPGGVLSAGLGAGLVASMYKLAKALESISGSIKTAPDLLKSLENTLVAYQDNLKADTIKKIAISIGVLAGALVLLSFADPKGLNNAITAIGAITLGLAGAFAAFSKVVEKIKTVPTALDSLANGLGDAANNLAKAQKWKAIGSMMKSFAITIGVIVASIAAVAYMWRKDPEALTQAVKLVTELSAKIGAMVALLAVISSLLGRHAKEFESVAVGVLALSASLYVMVSAVKKLMKIKIPEDSDKRIEILKTLLYNLMGLTVVVGLSSRIAGSHKMSAAPFIAMSVFLITTVSALKKIFKMDLPKDYKARLGILRNLFIGIGGMAIVIGAASRLSGGGKMSFAPILAFTIFLHSAVKSLKTLMEIKLPADATKRFWMLEGLFITLGVVMTAVSAAGKLSGGALRSAGTVLSMCIFLVTVTAALAILSLIDGSKLLKGAVSLGLVLVAVAAAFNGAGKITDPNSYKSVIAMAAVIGSVTASLGVLSMISTGGLLKSATTLGAILLVLATDFAAVGKINNDKAWISVLAMIGVMASIVAAIAILANYSWSDLISAGTALSEVLLSFSGAMLILSNAKKINPSQLATFLAASLIMAPIAAALFALAGRPWEGLVAAGAAMSLVLVSFAETMKMLSSRTGIKLEKVQNFLLASLIMAPIAASIFALAGRPWEGLLAASAAMSLTLISFAETMKILSSTKGINPAQITAFIAAAAMTIPIGAVIGELAKNPWDQLLAAGAALSEVILAISAALVLVSIAGQNAAAAQKGLILLAEAIAGIGVVVAAAGALNKIEGVQEFVSGGGDLLAKIGEAFGKLISGIGVGLASGLPQIGLYLSQFAINVVPFMTTMRMFDSGVLDGVANLSGMILTLTATSLLNSILGFINGGVDFVDLGKQLADFGPYIKKFATQISGVNADSLNAASAVGSMIAALYDKMPREGGWMQKIIGEKESLVDFGNELVLFGPSIAMFANIVKDVKKDAVEGAASAAGIMAELYAKLPESGGLKQKILGEEKTLSDFGFELVIFGPSIASFAEMVKDVKPAAVKGAASAAGIMAGLYEKLPEVGGLKQKIFGEGMSLSDFGAELIAFGPNIAEFADAVKDVMSSTVTGASNAATMMANLANNLPSTKTLKEKFFGGGKVTLKEFGQQLVDFAPNIVNFADAVKDIKSSTIQGAMSACDLIVKTTETITKQGSAKQSLSDFGTELKKFGESLKAFYDKVSTVDFSEVGSITQNIQKLVDVAKKAGKNGSDAFVKEFNAKNGNVVKAVNGLIQSAIKKFTESNSKFLSSGKKSGKQYINGINSAISSSMNYVKNRAEQLGKWYVDGFSKGVKVNQYIAVNAAKAMAKKTDEAVAKVLDEHSPSKLAEQRGRWYDEGLAHGITRNTNVPVKAVVRMASSVNQAAARGLEVQDIMGRGLEALTKKANEAAKAIRYISKPMEYSAKYIQSQMDLMQSVIAKGYSDISKMTRQYEANQKKLEATKEKTQQEEEKRLQKYEEAVQKYQEWLKMSKKEREKKAKEDAKEAKILAKAQAMAFKEVYGKVKERSKKLTDETSKYYETMSKIKVSGNNKLLYEDKTFAEFEIDILQRITDTLQKYNEKFTETRQSIMDQMNFFDEVEKKEVITKEQLVQNAKDQLEVYTDWIETQESLQRKIGDTALGDYLKTLGVGSVDQLKVINSMTEQELNEYVSLYDQKFQLSTVAAKNQLSDFQKEVEDELLDILGGFVDTINLFDFMAAMNGGLEAVFGSKQVDKTAKSLSKNLTKTFTDLGPILAVNAGNPLGTAIATAIGAAEAAELVTQKSKIETMIGVGLTETGKKNRPKAESAGKGIAKAGSKGLSPMKDDFYNIGIKSGQSLVDGLASQLESIRAMGEEMRNAAANAGHMGVQGFTDETFSRGSSDRVFSSGSAIGSAFANGLASALQIHSPSKVTEGLADYAIIGFIGELMSSGLRAFQAGEMLGLESASGLEAGVQTVTRLFDDLILDPVITPVLDTSGLEQSIQEMNRMFNDSIRIIAQDAQITVGTMDIQSRREQGESGNAGRGVADRSFIYNQYITSPKALSEIDIYRNTNNQFARFREAVSKR